MSLLYWTQTEGEAFSQCKLKKINIGSITYYYVFINVYLI